MSDLVPLVLGGVAVGYVGVQIIRIGIGLLSHTMTGQCTPADRRRNLTARHPVQVDGAFPGEKTSRRAKVKADYPAVQAPPRHFPPHPRKPTEVEGFYIPNWPVKKPAPSRKE